MLRGRSRALRGSGRDRSIDRSIDRPNPDRKTDPDTQGRSSASGCILLTQFALSRTTHIPITSVNIVVAEARAADVNCIFLNGALCANDDTVRTATHRPEESKNGKKRSFRPLETVEAQEAEITRLSQARSCTTNLSHR